ncbi:hypothetical protein LCGC14_1126270 [marine sediment metagenome]|uniref:Uncharacterized protein n=1 Tax=marine sediment metagenome TaxID=412755 RepID=A0A0F9MQG2_9ZZZZ
MRVSELIIILKRCAPDARILIMQEEELECMPEFWDDETRSLNEKATKLYSEDLHSHEVYLFAVKD